MSTSSVTRSGLSAWICLSASKPLRAVPTTVNSPESSMMCDVIRRMNALSSTTSTLGLDGGSRGVSRVLEDTRSLAQRTHFYAPIAHEQVHAASIVGARVLGDERNLQIREDPAHRDHVPLADVDSARRN